MSDRRVRRGFFLAFLLLLVVVLAAVLWKLPEMQLAGASKLPLRDRLQLENDFRVTIAQILGGTFLLTGAFFAWRNLRTSDDVQLTNRFSQAVQQLSHQEVEVRLGGIYALERIARDSRKDHWTVMEVLTASIRERTSAEGAPRYGRVPTDLQAIMTVISRRTASHDPAGSYLNLRDCDLRDVILTRAPLRGASFRGSNFVRSELSGADLRRADFTYSDLSRANCSGADFRGAALNNVDLRDAHLEKAKFDGAQLIAGKLAGAHMENADFGSADLSGADLSGADIRGADLSHVKDLSQGSITNVTQDSRTRLPVF
jgi:hypothetical protein